MKTMDTDTHTQTVEVFDSCSADRDDDLCGDDGDDDCQYIFPQRLMSILGNEKNHDAICWLPSGRAFIIRNRNLFAAKIMPRFFPRKSKYSSFTRKLNRWNFVRVSSGPDLGAYYHEFFLRDKPHLAAQMFCKNARSKIAMASEIANPTVASVATASLPVILTPPPAQPPTEPPPVRQTSDPTMIFLRNQVHSDPTLQLLLKQHVRLASPPQLNLKHRQGPVPSYPLHQQPMNLRAPSQLQLLDYVPLHHVMSTLRSETSAFDATLWHKIQSQKQKEDRVVQLRQLMVMNAHRQQSRNAPPNKFRASAA